MLSASANAWRPAVTWGDSSTAAGEPIVWGTACPVDNAECDNRAWGVRCTAAVSACDAIERNTSDEDIVRDLDCSRVACREIGNDADSTVEADAARGKHGNRIHAETLAEEPIGVSGIATGGS